MTVQELSEIMQQQCLFVKAEIDNPELIAFITELQEYAPLPYDFTSFVELAREYKYPYVYIDAGHTWLAEPSYGKIIDLSQIELRARVKEDDFQELL